jgi:outer membrane protein OmpA-like peptidoglycan-associated protein
MKKYIFTVIAICLPSFIFAQQKNEKSYFQVNLGGGYHSLNYNAAGANVNGSIGGLFEGTYHYKFNKKFGFYTGLSYSNYRSRTTLNNLYTTTAFDSEGDPFELRTQISSLKENTCIGYFQVPLMAQFHHSLENKDIELSCGLGIKLGFSAYASSEVKGGNIERSAYYPQWNVTLNDLPGHDLTTTALRGQKTHSDMRTQFALSAEAGAYFKKLIPIFDVYAGAYLDWGLNDVSTSLRGDLFTGKEYVGISNSNIVDKIKTFAVGVKVGIRFNPKEIKAQIIHVKPKIYHRVDTVVVVNEYKAPQKQIDPSQLNVAEFSATEDMRYHRPVVDMNQLIDTQQLQDYVGQKTCAIIAGWQFDFNKSKTKASDRAYLLARTHFNTNQKYILVGYADKRGSKTYNRALSVKRSKAVYRILRKQCRFKGSNIALVIPKDLCPFETNEENRAVFLIKVSDEMFEFITNVVK